MLHVPLYSRTGGNSAAGTWEFYEAFVFFSGPGEPRIVAAWAILYVCYCFLSHNCQREREDVKPRAWPRQSEDDTGKSLGVNTQEVFYPDI